MSLVEHETAPAMPAPEDNLNDSALALSARQLAHLAELREIGMALARDLGKRAANHSETGRTAKDHGFDIGLAFARVARAVRQIVALEQEIAGLREKRRETLFNTRYMDRKQSVRRVVRDALRADAPDIDPMSLKGHLRDLFRDYDDYKEFDYADGDMGEIVARICGDLGVEVPDPAIWADVTALDDGETSSTVVPLLGTEFRVDARNECEHDGIGNHRAGTGPP